MKIKSLVIGLILVILLASFVSAYCNETIVMANNSQTSSNYNITRTCTEEYNNASFYFAGMAFLVFLTLSLVGFFLSKKIHFKVVLAILISILIATISRFSAWFIEITNPLETNLIDTLNHFYMFGVWAMRLTIIFGIFYLVIVVINVLITWKKGGFKKDDWTDWGNEKL